MLMITDAACPLWKIHSPGADDVAGIKVDNFLEPDSIDVDRNAVVYVWVHQI